MRARILALLAYTGAAVSLIVAACVPFVLMGLITKAVAHAGLHVDDSYSGGVIARTLSRSGYHIDVYQPVRPRALQALDPFVQIAFRPAASLPARISEDIDLDGDGQPDARVSFTVPSDPHARPTGTVVALNSKYRSFAMPGSYSFSQLMVHSGDAILVRVPMNESQTP